MRGTKGHSLPIYSKFDSWKTSQSISFGRNDSRLRAKLESQIVGNDSTEYIAVLNLDGNPIVRRYIRFIYNDRVIVRDQFLAPGHGSPIVRFLLDPSIQATQIDDTSVLLNGPARTIQAKFECVGSTVDPLVSLAESHVALEHHKAAKTSEILIRTQKSEQIIEIESSFIIK